MKEQDVSFPFSARYYKLNEINASTRQIWFVLHGYGQLAQYFVRKFSTLAENDVCIIAPEGLSHFYLEELQASGRKNDRVGATWMTRENRLMDIQNYCTYLTSVYKKEVKDLRIPVTILGFSQGSATASRWVLQDEITFARLILWAGIFPPDMDLHTGSKVLQSKDVYMVYGLQDPFITAERFAEMKAIAEKLNTPVKELTFDGVHDVDEPTLLKFL
jgi:predicted esterase